MSIFFEHLLVEVNASIIITVRNDICYHEATASSSRSDYLGRLWTWQIPQIMEWLIEENPSTKQQQNTLKKETPQVS